MQVEDRLLVWRLNRGDATALSRVYEKYREDLLRLAVSLLNNTATAEDIVQDVFVRFAGSARVFRLTGSLKGYLGDVRRQCGPQRAQGGPAPAGGPRGRVDGPGRRRVTVPRTG